MLRVLAAILGILVTCIAYRQAPDSPASTAAAPQATPASPRPRDVDLTGLDPCGLLTPAQRADLGLNLAEYRNVSKSVLYGGTSTTAASAASPAPGPTSSSASSGTSGSSGSTPPAC